MEEHWPRFLHFPTVTKHVLMADSFLRRLQIIHGAIKPDNLLLTADGEVRLIDFGNSSPEDAPGRARGPAAPVPELLRGEAPSYASDLWAFGAGCRLLSGDSQEAIGHSAASPNALRRYARLLSSGDRREVGRWAGTLTSKLVSAQTAGH